MLPHFIKTALPAVSRSLRRSWFFLAALTSLLCAAWTARAQEKASALPWYTVRVQAIQCTDDDGRRECLITAQEVQQMVNLANQIYAEARIRFAFSPTQDFASLKSTRINSLMPLDMRSPTEERMAGAGTEREQNQEIRRVTTQYPGKMVVFFRWGDGKSHPTGNGYSGGNLSYVAMPSLHTTNMGLRGFAHEAGHYLGLSHTFARTFANREEASAFLRAHDNNIALFDGDGLDDTPPDPGLDIAFNNGVVEVVLNGITLKLPTGNIMSYMNWDQHEWLSALQAQRARSFYRMRMRFGMALSDNLAAKAPLEAENLPCETRGPIVTIAQSMTPFGPQLWSGEAQRFCAGDVGGALLLQFSVPSAGRKRLDLYMTLAPDYGMLAVFLDNKRLGDTFDGFAPAVIASGPVSFGSVYLSPGIHTLRFEIIGKHAESRGYAFGVDCLDLVPTDADSAIQEAKQKPGADRSSP